ncbi:RagB/SusD family nutrient uptake outer membrane protein [Galbibacter mesophilus]|uniref:RagB/SusD family nutrient uptake outer membrane protein n=1 Tax=Galbibacter mesophilus TaxID=379069 RepID=UPI00191F5317|nr:RagB/SusD family nutrient uptake outer membrane protein [Galbibacter mesophilus]MCM5662751.1 RagB/SusD family nutrient uptake outer membrane protein [Galbibacter mesophilus]
MKNILIIIAISWFFSSCNLADAIDQDPPNNLVPENVVKNEDDARALLNGVYSKIISFTSSYYYMYSETIPSNLIGTMNQTGTGEYDPEFFENNLQSDNSTVESYWLIFYGVIDAANNAIKETSELSIEEISSEDKKEIIGEAKFLRAMATFDALRYFGQFYDRSSELGIIVRTEPVNFTTRSKKRSTVEESYKQILTDLDDAISEAPEFTVNYRGSRLAAMALKARVLLYMGEYDKAVIMADEVINSGYLSLENSFSDVFDKGINSTENIFMTYRDANSDIEENNRKRFYVGRVGEGWFTNLMENDPRQPATYNESSVLKTNNEASYRPTFFLRLSEMHLIKAESILKGTNDLETARQALNIIKKRAGNDPSTANTTAALENEIFEEYIKEMAFENGSDWFAGIRFNKAMDLKNNLTSVNQYILPIPKSEIEGNEFLTLTDQNPGYE